MSAPGIRSTATLDDTALAAALTACFEAYLVPATFDAGTVGFMARTFDLDREAGRVLVEDGAPVAVAMLGRRGTHGWVGGMGVVVSRRRHGYGRRVMEALIAEARGRGVTRLDLEVLVHNTGAIALYESLGFVRTRTLDVWRFAPPAPPAGVEVAPLAWETARAAVRRWRTHPEPWQRADGSLERMFEQGLAVEAAAARADGRDIGAMLYRAAGPRVSVLQLGAAAGAEARAVPALLASLARPEATEGIRWLNLPADDPVAAVVRTIASEPEERQYEMTLRLDPDDTAGAG